ncbi:MAG: IS110 family transposase [Oscillospiraceae bacterium]|nr:IS110 family transposase [Oscillospiraceae bacterium]
MEALLYCCCGLDVHRDVIEACILRGADAEPEIIRQSFGAAKPELQRLMNWLSQNGCYTVAMESTGVYWKPIFQALELGAEYMEQLWVVNANHMRNLPGRKSDVADAEWIATLLRHGLLEKSFVPPAPIRDLRECARLHRTFVQERSRYVNRLEKFLQAHGFKFSSVMKDILSVSGRKLLDILQQTGSLTQADVEKNCRRLRRSTDEISAAVCGNLSAAERRLLGRLLHKLDSCQEDIDGILEDMRLLCSPFQEQLAIVDSIPGFDQESSMEIIAEISAAPQEYFSSPQRLCKWAGVVPRNDETAKKIKSKKILHGNTYVKSILCQAAWAAVKVRGSPFHNWFWSHQRKIGQKKAIIAIARKLLMLIYLLLNTGQMYRQPVTET